MAKVSDVYSGEFMNAQIAENQKLYRKTLTIVEENLEIFNEGEDNEDKKISIGFDETRFKLILNKTSANTLARIYGDDSTDWIGHHIQLMKVPTSKGDSIQVDTTYDEREDETLINTGEAKASPSSQDNQGNYDEVMTIKDDPHTAHPEDDPEARALISAISLGMNDPDEKGIIEKAEDLKLRGEISPEMLQRIKEQLKRKY